jgi:hypothetical protein
LLFFIRCTLGNISRIPKEINFHDWAGKNLYLGSNNHLLDLVTLQAWQQGILSCSKSFVQIVTQYPVTQYFKALLLIPQLGCRISNKNLETHLTQLIGFIELYPLPADANFSSGTWPKAQKSSHRSLL